ncbi:nuclear cap-binding protein [Babesia ovata]|uniref:Nuclear cap-binding protein n=1 Tax=Babesia ovata TaxID=189622 RepID=A0A2H6K9D0_9APIC|nr:nuclear cap-binding protein [Babesia ovata]GBE59591.1 nuclear cap-binding protein [Babesia ovata]
MDPIDVDIDDMGDALDNNEQWNQQHKDEQEKQSREQLSPSDDVIGGNTANDNDVDIGEDNYVVGDDASMKEETRDISPNASKRRRSTSPDVAEGDGEVKGGETVSKERGKQGYGRGRRWNKFRRTHNESENGGPEGTDQTHQRRRSKFSPEISKTKQWDTVLITALDVYDYAKEDIMDAANTLEEVDDTSKPSIATFERCVEAFPIKTGAYASVVGILKAKGKATLAEHIVQRVLHNLVSSISSGNRIAAIHNMRFLIGTHCAGFESCQTMQIIEALIKIAKNIEEAEFESHRKYVNAVVAADNLMYIVMASLPWFSCDEYAKNKKQIHSFCDEIAAYSDRRNYKMEKVASDLKRTDIDPSNDDHLHNPYAYIAAYNAYTDDIRFEDRLTTGVECLRSLREHDWISSTAFRFYQSKGVVEHIFAKPAETEVADEVAKVTQEILQAILKIEHDKTWNFKPVPFMPLNFALRSDKYEKERVHDKWLFQEHVIHTIHVFMDDTDLCARQLIKIPFNHYYGDRAILEILFNMMLSPIYRQHFSMFGILVIHNLCNIEHKMEGYFHDLYSQLTDYIPRLDPTVVSDLITVGAYWFSVEFCKVRKLLASTKLYKLRQKAEACGMDIEADRKEQAEIEEQVKEAIKVKNKELFSAMFEHNVRSPLNFNQRLLDKISRLVYMDKLLNYAPESLKDSIRAAVQVAPLNVQQAFRDKPIEHRVFLNLLHFNKLTAEENELRNRRIESFINNLVGKEPLKELPPNVFAESKIPDVEMTDEAEVTADPTVKRWSREELILIFWESLVIFGNKSLTHLMRLLEFHGEVLKRFIANDQEGAFQDSIAFKALRLTHQTLKNTKKFELVMGELLKLNVISPADACRLVFHHFPTSEFFSNHSLTIIDCAFDIARDRVEHARTRLSDPSGNAELHRTALEEREGWMRQLTLTLLELANNFMMQRMGDSLESSLTNIVKNVLLRNATHSYALSYARIEAVERGFHRRLVAAVDLALLVQSVQTPF